MSLDDVITIDCLYRRPRQAASFLMIENGEAAFVETNTVHAVPILLKTLKQSGVAPERVRLVIVTHIHFDHAGGASVLLDHCPNAELICHPRAQRHLADPARLIESAKRVYGAEQFERLYMPMHAIAEDRVRSMDDGEQLVFGGRTFTFVHTRGHANHHMCIHDSKTGGVFAGDAFGVEYDDRRQGTRPFLLCSSAPTDFDPDEALSSVDKIMAFHPSRLFLTHYDAVTDLKTAESVLKESIGRLTAVAKAAADMALQGEALQDFCASGVRKAVQNQADACGVTLTAADRAALESHIDVNGQGLAVYVEKRIAEKTP